MSQLAKNTTTEDSKIGSHSDGIDTISLPPYGSESCSRLDRALLGIWHKAALPGIRLRFRVPMRMGPGVFSPIFKRFRAPALAFLIAFAAGPSNAGTLSGGAGLDYQTGPHAQSYRSALLFASAERDAGDLTLAAIRYGDSRVGPGIGAFANGGV